MTRSSTRATALATALAAALLAAAIAGYAAADDGGEPIRLDYHAGSGCPDESAFLARIRARTTRARLVADGEHARTFTVQLTGGAHPSGSVTVLDGLGSEGTRNLDADTCDDVADALALMVALALDPRAPAAGPAPPAQTAPRTSDSGAPPPDAAPPATDASGPLPPPPAAPPVVTEAPAEGARAPAPLARHFFEGADFAIATGVTPSTLLAGAPFVGWRGTRASLFGPSVRASFLRAGTGALAVTGGSADFTWTVGRIDACGVLWPDRPLHLGACARAEGGVLGVSGSNASGTKTLSSGWAAAGVLARLEWSFLGPFLLDAAAGPSFRATAHPFYFPGYSSAYDVPVVAFSAEAGLGVHFP